MPALTRNVMGNQQEADEESCSILDFVQIGDFDFAGNLLDAMKQSVGCVISHEFVCLCGTDFLLHQGRFS